MSQTKTKVLPYPEGTVVKVIRDKNHYRALLPDGRNISDEFQNYQLRQAVEEGKALKLVVADNDKGYQWRKTSLNDFATDTPVVSNPDDHKKILEFLAAADALRPALYLMDDVKWRFSIRTVIRGENMLVVGPKGAGKTSLPFALRDVLQRPFFNIPMGATQDPRSSLIGNVQYSPEKGTYVSEAEFVRAIQTKNAIILLDEISRAHPDAWNLLMPVLDPKQRYLRIDESANTETIQVAEGVCFIATANIGSQYTATRVMDQALLDRFTIVEVDYLPKDQELVLLKGRVKGVDSKSLEALVAAAKDIRTAARAGESITEGLSTRITIKMAELMYDGFSFAESAELAIYTQYSDAGGAQSERSTVRQIVQKHIPVGSASTPFNTDPTDDDDVPWK